MGKITTLHRLPIILQKNIVSIENMNVIVNTTAYVYLPKKDEVISIMFIDSPNEAYANNGFINIENINTNATSSVYMPDYNFFENDYNDIRAFMTPEFAAIYSNFLKEQHQILIDNKHKKEDFLIFTD